MTVENLIIIIFFLFLLIYSGYLLLFVFGFFLPRKYFSDDTPKVSVIVAARDEEVCIERCINSICNQTYATDQFEVIVVNDQSEDATEKIVNSLQKKYDNLKLINIQNRPENYAPKKMLLMKH